MTSFRLILRSFAFYRRQHMGVGLGVIVAAAVISGALLVGDSVRHSLRVAALARLGQTHYAMPTGDRFFTLELAQRVAGDDGAAVLQLQAVAVMADLTARANQVQLLGIDEHFAALLGEPTPPAPEAVVLNEALARQLDADVGDTVVLRLGRPGSLSAELPVGFEEDAETLALRVRVSAITSDRFSLRSEQGWPANAYVSREWLASRIGQSGRANLLLASQVRRDPASVWTLADAQLELRPLDDGGVELRTPRVFIDDAVADAVADLPGRRILTYFVNAIAHGDRVTPYSLVTAWSGDLGDDGIALNTWLADDLNAQVGDRVILTYFIADAGRRLIEESASFTVKQIVPIAGEYADRALVPDFPGLDEVDRITDWDGGPMIDRSRIRPKDEDYWGRHRATPKAFLALETGRAIWSSRFGSLTAIRFDTPVTGQDVRDRIDPAAVGLTLRDVRAEALAASRATVDFGGLFLALSFFIIVAAVLLTALLFAFAIEQRAQQVGMLAALGWTLAQVRRLLLIEGSLVALAGAAVGVACGTLYTRAVLAVLAGGWSGAVAGTPVTYHATAGSLVIGFAAALAMAVGAMRLSLFVLHRQSIRALLAAVPGTASPRARHRPVGSAVCAVVLLGAAAALALGGDFGEGMAAAGTFFSIGSMFMLAGASAVHGWLAHRSRRAATGLDLHGLVLGNTVRRRGRSLAVVVLLASGVFLVIAVAGFRQASPADPTRRDSGTGGFTLLAEATLPLLYDLSTPVGHAQYGLDAQDLSGVVPVRVSGGDDASCLNLNRVPEPRVLGVPVEKLAQRRAFVVQHADGWRVLTKPLDNGDVPAIADANTARWALHMRVGDRIALTDDRGRPFTACLVATLDNSILQGGLIVAEEQFVRKYPDTPGYRMLLVDVPPADLSRARRTLTQALADRGVAVTETAQRLAAFNMVQNTYLSIFQALGGLGVLLGTAGLGVVVLRNLLERRRELAMMRAVGFDRARLRLLVFMEHAALLLAGVGIGAVCAAAAVAPSWRGSAMVWPTVLTTAGVLVLGIISVVCAARVALRGNLLAALRQE